MNYNYMHQHIRVLIKEKSEYFFLLTQIERFLRKIKNEHDIHHIRDLEEHLLEEIKKDVDGGYLSHKVEFIQIIREFIDAFELAFKAHEGQKRAGGEAYIVHPIHAALNEIYHQENEIHEFNGNTIVAALLHDTLEDTDINVNDLMNHFGGRITEIVQNLTDNPEWHKWSERGHISKLEEAALQFVNANKLEDSLDVKFDDRLSNLETLESMPEDKAIQKVIDTISVGYIERAEDLKEIKFLKVLKSCVEKYLTVELIKKYYKEDKAILSLMEKSKNKICQILERLEG